MSTRESNAKEFVINEIEKLKNELTSDYMTSLKKSIDSLNKELSSLQKKYSNKELDVHKRLITCQNKLNIINIVERFRNDVQRLYSEKTFSKKEYDRSFLESVFVNIRDILFFMNDESAGSIEYNEYIVGSLSKNGLKLFNTKNAYNISKNNELSDDEKYSLLNSMFDEFLN